MTNNDDFNFYEWCGIPDIDGNGEVDIVDAIIAEDMFYGDSYNTGLFNSPNNDKKDTPFNPLSGDLDDYDPFDFNSDIF